MSRSCVLLVLMFGCGDDGGAVAPDAGQADAPPEAAYDFSCVGATIPTTAPDPTSVSGTIVDYSDTQAISGVNVAVHRASDNAVLGTAVTAADGTYTTSVTTGGAAVEVYRRLTRTGYATTRVYGAFIVSASSHLENVVYSTAVRTASATGFGVTLDPQTGIIVTVIRDCANVPIVGARVSVSPTPASIGYYVDGQPSPTSTSTGVDGAVVAWGVPPGPATVTILLGSSSWRVRPVAVEADAVVLSFRQP